MDGALVADNGT